MDVLVNCLVDEEVAVIDVAAQERCHTPEVVRSALVDSMALVIALPAKCWLQRTLPDVFCMLVSSRVEDRPPDYSEIVEVRVVCAPIRGRSVEILDRCGLKLFPRERQLPKVGCMESVERRVERLPECLNDDFTSA